MGISGHENSNEYRETEEPQEGTYGVRESFGSADETLAIIICHVHAKFKYSRDCKTSTETKLTSLCLCDIMLKI